MLVQNKAWDLVLKVVFGVIFIFNVLYLIMLSGMIKESALNNWAYDFIISLLHYNTFMYGMPIAIIIISLISIAFISKSKAAKVWISANLTVMIINAIIVGKILSDFSSAFRNVSF